MTTRIQLSSDDKQILSKEMELKLHEVIFVEAREIHSPYHARTYLRNVVDLRNRSKKENPSYPVLPQETDQVAGICQKILLQADRFKELYSRAYKDGYFLRTADGEYKTATPWRMKLQPVE